MIKYIFFIFYFNILLPDECIENLYYSIIDKVDKNTILKIDIENVAISSKNQIDNTIQEESDLMLFVNPDYKELYIDFSNQILIMNKINNKIYYKETNQMYIENPDSVFLESVLDVFNNEFAEEFIEKNKNQFEIIDKNGLSIDINFNIECANIKYLNIVYENMLINIENIKIDTIDYNSINQYLKISEDYFEYDLR
tara:strand:+ start:263 stop:853 length:591 start_codon:yes stop_codon:yes gene_type:complete